MAEVLQALRADINKLGKQVSRELRSRQKTAQGPRFHSGPENPGPGPWASSNFDHYEYGSDSGDDSGWGTERNWRPNLSCGDQPALEDGNNEDAEEDEAFETQTTIQGRADCNVVAIDLWRSGTEEGAAVDRENETNQSTAVPASGPSRPSPQQQPGPPSNPIYSTSSPESVQCTSSTTLDFTPSPLSSNVFSGVMGGDQSTLDGETVNLQSLQREFEEAERQSAEPSGSSHDQSQEGRKNSKEFGQGSHKPGRRSVTPRKLTRTKTGGGSENIPSEDSW
ncbi:hypothetical protein EV426DRAFT_584460 [Tirmania nivea]|nr:hypothetical protein EV426DRAFT_584460 [Tirmania nivea]